MSIHMSVYMSVYMSIDMSINVSVQYINAKTQVCTHAYTHVCIHACRHVYRHVCKHAYTQIVRSSFHNIKKMSKKFRLEPRFPKTAVRREHFFSEDAEAKGAKKGKKGDALGQRHN